MISQAIKAYRDNFKPSVYLDKPYLMLAANLLLADDDDTANYRCTQHQSFVRLRGEKGQMPKPVADMSSI